MPKVLVVDDEADIVRLVRFRLEKEGWDVVSAFDGQSAIAAAIEHRPDLIFLDIMMPDMDGFDVLEEIRTRRGVYKTPVVMLTARRSGVDMDKARAFNVYHYITKPFDPELLITTAKKILLFAG
ncbi:MAG TPA: response regulator [Armatimonadota bacterium]|nr:response regulator [Armatimonadota bacterium]